MEGEEDAKKTKEEIEEKISTAMRARVRDFKEQADSLTLEGVRRALEKDLGMKTFSLDVHKRFIKQCLEECFYGADDENVSKTSGKVKEKAAQPVEEEKSSQPSAELKNNSSALDGQNLGYTREPADQDTGRNQDSECGSDLNEDTIHKAIKKRGAYFRANSAHLTLLQVRRLLEEDLKLETKTLDAYKSFISNELDEVLQSPEIVKSANGVNKNLKKASQNVGDGKTSKGTKRAYRASDSSDADDVLSEDEEVDEDATSKKSVAKKTTPSRKGQKRQKKSIEETKSSGSKKKKSMDPDPDKSSGDEGGNCYKDGQSHSSAEEEVEKKREKPAQIYGKRVEHLKSIIKACGMGIPPSVYKRAKQAPESKREAFLMKELEEMLRREDLSTNASEKEIKAVKKRKERAKELEGIDMSNIVSSSRRRSASNYIPPTKPKIEAESVDEEEDEVDEEAEDDEDNEEDTDDVDDGGESSEDNEEDAEDGSE